MINVTPVKREKLYNLIIDVLGYGEFTAREIATELYKKGCVPFPTRGMVHPRLTELEKKNVVEVSGTMIDDTTRKRVSIYRLVRT